MKKSLYGFLGLVAMLMAGATTMSWFIGGEFEKPVSASKIK